MKFSVVLKTIHSAKPQHQVSFYTSEESAPAIHSSSACFFFVWTAATPLSFELISGICTINTQIQTRITRACCTFTRERTRNRLCGSSTQLCSISCFSGSTYAFHDRSFVGGNLGRRPSKATRLSTTQLDWPYDRSTNISLRQSTWSCDFVAACTRTSVNSSW